MTIDRRAVVQRHDVYLRQPDAGNALTVGNGDFAFTSDITGMQTFTDLHTPRLTGPPGAGLAGSPAVVNTCTMSTWAWHEMPSAQAWTLADAMTTYESTRGPVDYPDRFDTQAGPDRPPAAGLEAGTWLHKNPQRLDLGRVGLEFRTDLAAGPESDPGKLDGCHQHLNLWTGLLRSNFSYNGTPVSVETVAHPTESVVAFRIRSSMLATGRLTVRAAFPYASDSFFDPADWHADDRHRSELTAGESTAVVHRSLDTTRYDVGLSWSSGHLTRSATHAWRLTTEAPELELVVGFAPQLSAAPDLTFPEVAAAAAQDWERFWRSGAAIDLAGSSDPRAQELERRIVLSQYLTKVNCSGIMPPQETGLVTNSWQGKSHLEMHWWHSAHFASWGRPKLLERSLAWYEEILPRACGTAQSQGLSGARWPKQVGPDGRESPSDIGSLLIWQQPHPIYYAELLHRANAQNSSAQTALVARWSNLVSATAAFMADLVEERDGTFHLPAPVMPAQEFYDARTTEDPTFELAYWWWAIETAQQWRERQGHERDPSWTRVQDGLSRPHIEDDHYSAIGSEPFTRVDDHPSMLAAFGFVPWTPLVEAPLMQSSLRWVRETWDWDTAWGWDFPVLAMCATRLGDPHAALDCLLMEAAKNQYSFTGHNPQMGSFLPIYLPGNGGLLAAVSLMVAGWEGAGPLPGFPCDGSWRVEHEGFVQWPS